ncbi:unnamed protein product [Rotaria socialis]|uniref:RING-type domain-containing protein n=2 Tax=Rotaria socialis TaxID=392032 RepID=A0A817ZPH7_9BILA|nr:unnamed protein product [Rotaria socialis]CAF3349581.1 unnamed protein product [Rotaria socialis]CAF3395294.1 unnamed protein product [Rotaria socialis]CAF3395862.1 unnamed protein product [Rotaria socialis]CAF3444680.1 unnamed protein product [Rotaria socialis]
MSKTEYTYVNEHLISPSLTCPICLNILEDPYTHTLCDSAFCRSCLEQLVDANCPICRSYFDNILPIDYNRQLPKSSRLIRNMLDELLVECAQCHTIRHRAEFEHDCQPMKNSSSTKTEQSHIVHLILSAFIVLLSILIIYYNRHFVFETAVDRRKELINDIAIDIDKFLFDKIYYLIAKIIEYSIPIFLLNLFLWFIVLFYGDRFTSKTASRLLAKFIEISTIVILIGYSVYY